jgi:uncharacterized protein YgbK (DUF1537 family)
MMKDEAGRPMRPCIVLDVSILDGFTRPDEAVIDGLLAAELTGLQQKIVVLDDDPTGVQTVHNISVYTDWAVDTLEAAFAEKNRLFFILTNSRGMIKEQTVQAHRQIAGNLILVSQKTGQDYLLISRSDSTLRGHYPIETQTLKDEIESQTSTRFDGEIVCPFFKEGGRLTLDNIHYVKEGSQLTPAGLTEFARDQTFGYRSSHLGDWCEEKTGGAYRAEDMIYITLADLRALNFFRIETLLLSCRNFNKIIVNALDTIDIKVFAIAFLRALAKGKHFILRSAAALPKVLGGVPDRMLLTRAELIHTGNVNGGIILVGSHVNKTTRQLEELRNCRFPIEMIEFNQHLVLSKEGLQGEVARVIARFEDKLKHGCTVAVYTRRDRLDLDTDDKDQQLLISVEISDAVTRIIAGLSVRPGFIIAKGGITSSNVGTKALRVRRANVMGQIRPGIPVWMTGQESKFPDMPYIIFPGNVGEVTTLREIVEILLA